MIGTLWIAIFLVNYVQWRKYKRAWLRCLSGKQPQQEQ